MELEALDRALDGLLAAEPDGSGQAVEALMARLARLEAVAARSAAAFAESREWAAERAYNARQWLAVRTRRPKGECGRLLSTGKAAGSLPVAAGAWEAGRIGAAHMRVLGGLRRPATAEALARDEDTLVAWAEEMTFEHFCKAARCWEYAHDPDGAEGDAKGRAERRQVWLEKSFGGMFLGGMTLDEVRGEIVAGELSRLEQALFEADRAEAKARLGRDPFADELARTGRQRRADALVEMAARSAAARQTARRPAPLFTVLVGADALARTCELASGAAVTPGQLAPWLAWANVERVVFGLKARVEVSERARLFTGATRRAIEVRDRECVHPYCDRPAPACQVDHIIPWEAGGPTTQDNGRLLCGFHNRARHHPPPDDGGEGPAPPSDQGPPDDGGPPDQPPPDDLTQHD